jgi:hypothetical protein
MRFSPLLLLLATPLAAQSTSVVELKVVAPNGEPLRYSTIDVAGGESRFTTEEGKFNFTVPKPGTYQLRVKHLGFTALDTAITVGAEARMALTLMLKPVALHLSKVEVRDKNSCRSGRTPGTNLYIALEELRKNAERDRILRNSYPFVYKLARRYDSFSAGRNESPIVKQDTAVFSSRTNDAYRPGNIFMSTQGGRGTREVRIPSLSDLADDVFMRSHCFSFGGLQETDDAVAYRIDFTPAPNIASSDFEGSAYLDTATYMIRQLEFRITRPERVNVTALNVKTTFRELFPGLALFYTVRGVQPMGRYDLIDDQKLVEINFLRGSPSTSPQSREKQ